MVKMMLKLDTVRGPHSTGLLGVTKAGSCNIFKKTGTPWELEQYKGHDKFWQPQHNVIIGHNRFATQGEINHINAHPYQHEHLYGVHNGSLTNKWKLDDARDFDVDSDNLYHHMRLNGLAHTVKLIEGAFALVWYDKQDKTINFVRNKERPLHMAYSKDGKTLFWASESWMLLVAATKTDVKLEDTFEFDTATHAVMTLEGNVIGDAVNTKVEFAPPKVYQKASHSWKGKKTTPSYSTVHTLVGKRVKFDVMGVDEDIRSKLDYLDCAPLEKHEGKDYDIRLYMDCEGDQAVAMLGGLCSYEGVVTHCSYFGGEPHLVVSHKNITPVAIGPVKK